MLPNKVISIKNSILWKLPDIIKCIKENNNIIDVYHLVENKVDDINEFLYAIDILYLLEMIKVDEKKGTYIYVERN